MAMKFQYDEQGDSFVYFVMAFLVLVLCPSSYFFWPRVEVDDSEKLGSKCACDNCEHKRSKIRAAKPNKKVQRALTKIVLIIGWTCVALMAYKVATAKKEIVEFRPYEILELEPGATVDEIKKQYRKLSRVWHPDRHGGNETRFILITKAEAALTDPIARENWEKYGNPDGPGVTEFGIALPVWLVEGNNSIWVLGLYGLVFMIILPTAVGMWWYRSIRYTSEAVLIDTTKLLRYYFHRSSTLNAKRILLILTGACEFDNTQNQEIITRPDDNIHIPTLMRSLGTVQEKIKERPFGAPYSVKTRALLLAHLDRIELPASYLREDLDYILKKCPMLINEMINSCALLMMWYYSRQITMMPSIDTVENIMKLSQMLVQGLNEHSSALLQIPNIDAEILRHFFVKKRNIKSIEQFLRFPDDERRKLLRNLTDKQYNDVMSVCNDMPHIEAIVELKVVDDEDQHMVTAGAITTVNVRLIRHNLGEWVQNAVGDEDKDQEADGAVQEAKSGTSKSAYRRNKKKTKGKKGQGGTKQKKIAAAVPNKDALATGDDAKKPKENGTVAKVDGDESGSGGEESGSGGGSDSEDDKENHAGDDEVKDQSADDEPPELERSSEDEEKEGKDTVAKGGSKGSGDDDDDDKAWDDDGDLDTSRDAIPDVKSKFSHPVHCPYFPEDKQEWWWVYLADKKNRKLVSAPLLVTNLVAEESVQLKFTAQAPGTYNYTVVVKSDSYLDMDTISNLKFEVREAKEVDLNHPQWDLEESDEEKADDHDDDYASETDSDSN
ncbi:Translocation protein SEC63-like protein [Hypsibius exemplaris]|uniref:Translocation protein SEC63-like protein n=1 Tax=Hypsibius exemplaris TaxID=2072580 RepID=A0A1W0WPU9_HYPEX|nr:Translocation protein SEC63-like protein [Hypsibius exemplaris]